MQTMLEKVGGAPGKAVHTTAINDALGAHGWEMISHQTFLMNGVQWQYWTFRRPDLKK